MKAIFSIAVLILSISTFAWAQQGPPPPPAPEYSPNVWQEYSFANDSVRFRFPVKPIIEETVFGAEKHPSRVYSNSTRSFLTLQLTVVTFPSDVNLETSDMLNGAEKGGLNRIRNLEPKIIKNEEITVDGHAGKFLLVETNDGHVMRIKFFAVENRLYNAIVIVEKGKRHGFNWENDFEIPAMAFLDSIHVKLARVVSTDLI